MPNIVTRIIRNDLNEEEKEILHWIGVGFTWGMVVTFFLMMWTVYNSMVDVKTLGDYIMANCSAFAPINMSNVTFTPTNPFSIG